VLVVKLPLVELELEPPLQRKKLLGLLNNLELLMKDKNPKL